MSDPRIAFIEGAKWWEFESRGATMWQEDQNKASLAAESKYSAISSRVFIGIESLISGTDENAKRSPGRPPKLFTCNTCGKLMASTAVRSHKCVKNPLEPTL